MDRFTLSEFSLGRIKFLGCFTLKSQIIYKQVLFQIFFASSDRLRRIDGISQEEHHREQVRFQ